MSTSNHPLWDLADPNNNPAVVSPDVHPLWAASRPESVIITPKKDEDSDKGVVAGIKEQLSPSAVAIGAGASAIPVLATAAGFGLANRAQDQTPEQYQEIADRFKSAHDKAADAIKKGDYLGAARIGQDLLLGEGLKEPVDMIEDRISKGDYSGAAASTVSALGQLAVGHGLAKLVDFAGPWLTNKFTNVHPDEAITKALSPRPANPDFLDDLKTARGYIKQAELPNEKPIHFDPKTVDPNEDPNNLIPTIQRAKRGAMDALDTFLEPLRQRGQEFDGNKIADSIESTIPTELKVKARVDPTAQAQIQGIKDQASGFRQPLSTDEVKQMLIETNAQLNSLYHGTPDAQAAAMNAAGGKAMLEAKAKGLRGALYDQAGPQAAELNRVWGILDDHEAAAQARRIPAVKGELSASPSETLTKLADIPGKLAQGRLEDVQRSFGQTDSLVRRAYANTEPAGPYPTYRNPNSPQLEAGPVVTPAPADTSYVRGAPADRAYVEGKLLPPASSSIGVSGTTVPDVAGQAQDAGKSVGARRQIEAPPQPSVPSSGRVIITPSPADTSSVRGAEAMTAPTNPAKALPPATTRFQGDVSPGSGLPAEESHTLPTLPDGTKLEVLNAAKGIARDPKTGKFFRYYTSGAAPTPIQTLKLRDLQ